MKVQVIKLTVSREVVRYKPEKVYVGGWWWWVRKQNLLIRLRTF